MNPEHQDLAQLAPEVRLLRCHELAEAAFERAAEAASETERDALISIGRSWRSLALETEAVLRRLRGLNSPDH